MVRFEQVFYLVGVCVCQTVFCENCYIGFDWIETVLFFTFDEFFNFVVYVVEIFAVCDEAKQGVFHLITDLFPLLNYK